MFSPSNYFFNIHALPFFVSGALITIEAAFVYFQNRKSLINIGFATVTVCAGFWLVGIGLIYSSSHETAALIWSRYFCWLGIIFISPSVYLFSTVWKDKSLKKARPVILFNYTVALVFYVICIATSSLVKGLWSYSWGFYPKAGMVQNYFMVWYVILMILSFRNFIQNYIYEDVEIHKKHTGFVILAFIFGGIGGSLDYLGNYGIALYPSGSFCVLLFSTVIAYSIVNYRLMDIETVLHKTALWILSFSLIVVPILMVYQWVFPHIKSSTVLQFIFVSLYFVVFAVYLRLIQPKVDHFFQRRKANFEEISNQFISDLVHLKGLDSLIQRLEETITNTLYPQGIDIFIYDEKKKNYHMINRNAAANRVSQFPVGNEFLIWLNRNNSIVHKEFVDTDPKYAAIKDVARDYFDSTGAMVVIPLVLNERLLGVINLGKKANLRRYNAVDFHFLTTMKNQSAIAISNSLIYQNIEEQVKERTRELVEVQKQLVQAEKLATVGTLSGGVAHEINNPLTAILTNVQMLLTFSESTDAKMDREALEIIEEATQRCRTIVQKMMAYAKKPLESDQVAKIDLSDVLQKAVSFINYQLEQDSIQIDIDAHQSPYSVMGNGNELEQVLTNLILNARDAIMETKQKGKIQITLSKNERYIKVRVKDEGIGISEEHMAKIFDPFFTTKDVGKGLGLGLSICQSIIEKHQGQITVESKPGEGAAFTVHLPWYSG